MKRASIIELLFSTRVSLRFSRTRISGEPRYRDPFSVFFFPFPFPSLRIEKFGFSRKLKIELRKWKWRCPFPLLKRASRSCVALKGDVQKGKAPAHRLHRRERASTFFDLRVITRMHGPARRVLINVIGAESYGNPQQELTFPSLFSAIRLDRIPDENPRYKSGGDAKKKKKKSARPRCLMDFDRKCEANVT